MGIASHERCEQNECCERNEGLFGSNFIWIILLILFFCGGFGGGFGCCERGLLGGNFFGNGSIWILIILFFFCFCGKRIF